MKYNESQRMQTFDALFNEFALLCHEIAKSQGLSDSAYDVLETILMLGEGCTQTEVFQKGCFNKQTINSAVKKLVEQDILWMQSGKGRESKLFFTEKGKAFVKLSIVPFEKAETEVYDEFTEEEYQQLLRLTSQYVNSYKNKVEKLIGGSIDG